ncbi:MAG TPA: response regulator transcription factor [Terriglobales bacterium]|nr:response regulator transcription factor [Terriglobales bacterium]
MNNSILIADDSEVIRRSLRNLIGTQTGLTVCGEAENGVQAIEKAHKLKPDLILMDFSMPLMNGLDAATQLKKDSPRVPIVMLTMFKDKFLEERAYRAGVSLVLSKEESMVRVADYARILLKPDAPAGANKN